MTDKKAREVAVVLSQNLISFHKGAPRFGADAKNAKLLQVNISY
jgi:hypothetical protein